MVRIGIALLHQEQYLMGCCSFCFAWILWSSKRADSNSPCPAAWQIPSGALKKRIAMYFCNALFGLMLFWAIPHNSKCRYGERGAAAAKPKAQIILDVLSSILATQMPCRSRRSGA